jgi:hypothetical protein
VGPGNGLFAADLENDVAGLHAVLRRWTVRIDRCYGEAAVASPYTSLAGASKITPVIVLAVNRHNDIARLQAGPGGRAAGLGLSTMAPSAFFIPRHSAMSFVTPWT